MTARCKNCSSSEIFEPFDEFGIRIKLKDQVCECGGKYEKMYPTQNPDRYINSKADSFMRVDGKFKKLRPITI